MKWFGDETSQNSGIAVAIACRPLVTTAGSCHRLDRIPRSWATDRASGANLPINLLSITRRFQCCSQLEYHFEACVCVCTYILEVIYSSILFVEIHGRGYHRKQKNLRDKRVVFLNFYLGCCTEFRENLVGGRNDPEKMWNSILRLDQRIHAGTRNIRDSTWLLTFVRFFFVLLGLPISSSFSFPCFSPRCFNPITSILAYNPEI